MECEVVLWLPSEQLCVEAIEVLPELWFFGQVVDDDAVYGEDGDDHFTSNDTVW